MKFLKNGSALDLVSFIKKIILSFSGNAIVDSISKRAYFMEKFCFTILQTNYYPCSHKQQDLNMINGLDNRTT